MFWVNTGRLILLNCPEKGGNKSTLVRVNTFSGWPEAIPCCTNQAGEVTKILLNQVITGFPLGMSSDRDYHFITEVIEQVRIALGTAWDLHSPYRPQAIGKLEGMNDAIKLKLGKTCRETLTQVQTLPGPSSNSN